MVKVKCVEEKGIGVEARELLGKGAVLLLPLSRPLGKAAVSPGPLMVEDAATRTDFKAHC